MNALEEHILKKMIETASEKVILKDNENISYFKENKLIEELGKIRSDDIFNLILPNITTKQLRELYEKRAIKVHYKFKDQYFTIQVVSNEKCSVVIKKGKNDLFPNTDIIIPEVKVGDKYRYINNDCYESWILVGIKDDYSLNFLTNEKENYEEKTIIILEFLKLLREGKLFKE